MYTISSIFIYYAILLFYKNTKMLTMHPNLRATLTGTSQVLCKMWIVMFLTSPLWSWLSHTFRLFFIQIN